MLRILGKWNDKLGQLSEMRATRRTEEAEKWSSNLKVKLKSKTTVIVAEISPEIPVGSLRNISVHF